MQSDFPKKAKIQALLPAAPSDCPALGSRAKARSQRSRLQAQSASIDRPSHPPQKPPRSDSYLDWKLLRERPAQRIRIAASSMDSVNPCRTSRPPILESSVRPATGVQAELVVARGRRMRLTSRPRPRLAGLGCGAHLVPAETTRPAGWRASLVLAGGLGFEPR